jgi:hypothetical protein
VRRAAWRANSRLRLSRLAAGRAANCGTANQPSGTVASVAASGAPRFPCGAALAVAAPEASYQNVVSAARVAAVDSAASVEMSDHSEARAVADPAVARDNGSAIGRNDGLGLAAGRAVARRTAAAAALARNSAAVPDNSSALAADNFSPVAIHNSAAVVIDSFAEQNNCVPAGTDSGAGLEAGWVLPANGWVPDEKDAAGNRRDDFEQDRAPLPELAS